VNLKKINLQKIRVNIPLSLSSQNIVVSQSTQHVEEIEQCNDNITPFQENITTKNIVELP
jgi:hypothetical protein